MGQLTELKQIRKKRNRKRNIKKVMILCLVGVVVILLFFLIDKLREFDVKTKIDDALTSMGGGPGFPIDITGRDAKSLFEVSKLPAIVNDSNVYVYNSKGKLTTNIQHGYNKPIAYGAGGRILIYDVGATKLKVHSLSKLLYEKQFEKCIITANISKSGAFGVAIESDNYVGEVILYNKYGDQFFKWCSSENLIIGMALSDDGDNLAVTAVNSANGGLISYLYIFKVNSKSEPTKYTYTNELPLSVKYTDTNKVTLITDKSLKVVSTSGREIGNYSFNNQMLYGFDISNKSNSAIILGDHRQVGGLELITLDDKANELGNVQIDKKINSVKIDEKGSYITIEDEIIFYDLNAVEMERIKAPLVRKALVIGNDVYYSTHNQIYKTEVRRIVQNSQAVKINS